MSSFSVSFRFYSASHAINKDIFCVLLEKSAFYCNEKIPKIKIKSGHFLHFSYCIQFHKKVNNVLQITFTSNYLYPSKSLKGNTRLYLRLPRYEYKFGYCKEYIKTINVEELFLVRYPADELVMAFALFCH